MKQSCGRKTAPQGRLWDEKPLFTSSFLSLLREEVSPQVPLLSPCLSGVTTKMYDSSPSGTKANRKVTNTVVHACNPTIRELKAKRISSNPAPATLQFWGQPEVQRVMR